MNKIKLKNPDRPVGGKKMTLEYRVISDIFTDEDGTNHRVYGISVYKKTKENETLIKEIPDIFTDFKRAEALAAQCAFTHVHPDKLYEVIEIVVG